MISPEFREIDGSKFTNFKVKNQSGTAKFCREIFTEVDYFDEDGGLISYLPAFVTNRTIFPSSIESFLQENTYDLKDLYSVLPLTPKFTPETLSYDCENRENFLSRIYTIESCNGSKKLHSYEVDYGNQKLISLEANDINFELNRKIISNPYSNKHISVTKENIQIVELSNSQLKTTYTSNNILDSQALGILDVKWIDTDKLITISIHKDRRSRSGLAFKLYVIQVTNNIPSLIKKGELELQKFWGSIQEELGNHFAKKEIFSKFMKSFEFNYKYLIDHDELQVRLSYRTPKYRTVSALWSEGNFRWEGTKYLFYNLMGSSNINFVRLSIPDLSKKQMGIAPIYENPSDRKTFSFDIKTQNYSASQYRNSFYRHKNFEYQLEEGKLLYKFGKMPFTHPKSNCSIISAFSDEIKALPNGLRDSRFKGTTPLVDSVNLSNYNDVLKLLASKHNPNIPDFFGETPLHHAVSLLSPKLVRLLLNYNAVPNVFSDLGYTPTHELLQFGFVARNKQQELLSILKDLRSSGADFNLQTINEGKSVLHFSVMNKSLAVTKYLARNMSNINATDSHGRTALSYAVEMLDTALVEILLKHRASVNVEAKAHDLPLVVAVMNGLKDYQGLPARDKIARENLLSHLIEILISKGSATNPLLDEELPLAAYAKAHKAPDSIISLLTSGASDE
ncbi:MAG: ankyrin repeat domain-containing protein [Bacteriovoracaceae bacterium]|nr:ankyrin repeat domain-containing protein [Bacteriovoracaceae bacterium]